MLRAPAPGTCTFGLRGCTNSGHTTSADGVLLGALHALINGTLDPHVPVLGAVVLWASNLLLIALFLQLPRIGARKQLIHSWIAAWTAGLLGVSFIAVSHATAILDLGTPSLSLSILLAAMHVPGKLAFLAFVLIGVMEIAGYDVSADTKRRFAVLAVAGGLTVHFFGGLALQGRVLAVATPLVLFGAVQMVLRKATGPRTRSLQYLAAALGVFATLASFFTLIELRGSGITGASRMYFVLLGASGWGGVIGTVVLASSVLVIIVRDSFFDAEDSRSRRLRDLAASEARLSGIIQAAREAILTINGAGTIEMANTTAEALFAMPPGRLVGASLAQLVQVSPGVLADVMAEATSPQVKARPSGTATLTAAGRRPDGTTFPVEFTVGPMPMDDGVGCVVVMRDLTQRYAAEAEREEFARKLAESEKMLAIGRVASGVAHELNNPLAVVLSQSEYLADGAADAETQQGIKLINEQALRARHIVRDLLSYVRHRQERRDSIDLVTLVRRVIVAHQDDATANAVALAPDLPAGPVKVVGDRVGMEQVLVNLVDNAIDAASSGGLVRIAVRHVDTTCELIVEDSGPGVPAEYVGRIFEPFFTTKRPGDGTGLGLAVSLGLVEQQGGKLDFQNRPAPGIGARFVITLPADQRSEAVIAAAEPKPEARTVILPAPATRADGSTADVLVIDDEASIRASLARIFRRGGWPVREVANGADGLAILLDPANQRLPALILCDLKMPGMGGREVYWHLDQHRPDLLRRLIFVTGDIVEQGTASFLSSVTCPVVEKPFTLDEIATAVTRVMHAQHV